MATRTIANGGGNYSATGTWVEGAVPTSADDVVATGTSGQLTVDVVSNAKTFILTGYTNTLTMTNTLTVAGSVTLVAAMTIAGSAALIISATSTLTSNGKTWPNSVTLSVGGAVTYTFADAWTITGTLTIGANNMTITLNGLLTTGTILAQVSNGNATFSGTTGFTTAALTLSMTAGRTFTLAAGKTYTVTTDLVLDGTAFGNLTLTAASAANLNLQAGATSWVGYVTATNINSSGGQQIFDAHGTLSGCTNWTTVQPATGGGGLLLNPGLRGGMQ